MDSNQNTIMKILSFIKVSLVMTVGLFAMSALKIQAQTATEPVVPTANALTNPTYIRDILPLFLGKCSRCHNESDTFLPNWADYKTAYKHRLEIKRRVWEAWKGKYYKEAMPAGNCPEMRTITEADREIIKQWVDDGAPYGTVPKETSGKPLTKELQIAAGQHIFAITCVPCHQANALGIPNRYPPLAQSDFLNADKDRAIKILINGRQGPITVNGMSITNSMPKFPLTDEQIANVLTYVYNSFGNSGKQVTPAEVKTARTEPAESPTPAAPAYTAPSKFE
jgi:mono/diheme cytochrome c family protein